MRIAGPFDSNVRPGVKALAAMPRRCEKSSDSSTLGQEQADLNAENRKLPSPIRVELVCQDGTQEFDPFWDGPRLLPAFAAQLIAQTMKQAMPDRRDATAMVETAYGSLFYPRMALLLDRKS
jgi:hypothetical protein